ncbi:MAG: ATP synthase F1 subunit delta [Deltaproteobacteria bacterium]
MIGGSLARRYARALLAIGEEEKQSRKILAEIERFAALLEESEPLRETMQAGHINRRDKHAALEAVLAATPLLPSTRNFLHLLIDKGRMGILSQILSEFRRMIERIEGIERVEVIVPFPLTESQRTMLTGVLAEKTDRKVLLEETVDPAVLGGMVVKVGSTVYDGSARTQIENIRDTLQKG